MNQIRLGNFVFLTGLETDCRQETGASRLSPTLSAKGCLPSNHQSTE
ncbi:MAG: hypothetical protein LBG58_04185 [Planctomycetaceae bacterium]|nr:hypothetical protein [Planctomycetaceae bacterium]